MAPYKLVVCVSSLAFNITTAALLFVLTASVSVGTDQVPFSLLLASALMETIKCITLAFLMYRARAWRCGKHDANIKPNWWRSRLSLLMLGVLPWIIAAALSAVALGTMLSDRGFNFFGRQTTTVTLVIWIVSFFIQVMLLLTLAFSDYLEGKGSRQSLIAEKYTRPMQQSSNSGTCDSDVANPFHDRLPSPPNLSPLDRSLRSSFSTIGRSTSSKRNFSLRSSSQPRQSERSSSDGPSSHDAPSSRQSRDGGFDSWDTSDLSTQMKETVLLSKPLLKCAPLPTIPGSRSPSPAKALEGPFSSPSPEHTPPRSPLPQPPVSQPTSPASVEVSAFTTRFPPPNGTSLSMAPPPPEQRQASLSSQPASPVSPGTPNLGSRLPPIVKIPLNTAPSTPKSQAKRFSRPPSLVRKQSGEEHIHPLFRCSSPTPPPSASPTTTVTAAPEAGEVIDRSTLNRMRSTSQRSSSQPPARSPLRRSESFANIRSNKISQSSSPAGAEPQTLSGGHKSLHQRKRSASFEGCIIRNET